MQHRVLSPAPAPHSAETDRCRQNGSGPHPGIAVGRPLGLCPEHSFSRAGGTGITASRKRSNCLARLTNVRRAKSPLSKQEFKLFFVRQRLGLGNDRSFQLAGKLLIPFEGKHEAAAALGH